MSRSLAVPFSRRAVLALAAFLAACSSVGPDFVRPEPGNVPASFQETAASGAPLDASPADLATWWRRLDDPLLDELVQQALEQNFDLDAAVARIAEARALRGGARAEFWPTLDADAGFRRRHESENTPFGPFAVDADRYTVGLDASWEIDLWGRVRRAVEAADAGLQASVESMRAVRVSVAAEVASNYVLVRMLQERLRIARSNLDLQQGTAALVQARFDSGLVGERDLAQAHTNLASTRARLPALEVEQRAAENRLAVLLGLPPGALAERLAAPQPIPAAPARLAVGVPAELLRRRPDVRAAEQELAAATARIGSATADLYPRLTLFGNVGYESTKGSDLFDTGSQTLVVGPSIRWNLFDGGAVRRRIAAEDARAQQALARFEQAVLLALEEAENAMTAFAREHVRREQLMAAAEAAARAEQLASTEYTEGLTDFQNVLDSQRQVADVGDELAASNAAVTRHLIALYKALGGGWESMGSPSSAAAAAAAGHP